MSSTFWFLCVIFFISANRLYAFSKFTANCAPRSTVVRIEHFPYFVLLHRCDGSCVSHPTTRKCLAKTHHEVQVRVLDVNGGGQQSITMKNHTSCGCGCVMSAMDCRPGYEKWVEDKCLCECKYLDKPPEPCKSGFIWDSTACRCQCNTPPKICPPKKVWNTESCGCVCTKRIINRCTRKEKGLDHENCECVDVQALKGRRPASVNSTTFIAVIAVLGLVVVMMFCVIIRMFVKRRRSPNIITYPEEPSPKTPPSRSDSGNISYSNGSVVCDGVQGGRKAATYQTDSNGSVCIEPNVNRESTL